MRFCTGVVLFLTAICLLPAQNFQKSDPKPDPPGLSPVSDKLTYDVEWRLIHAGTVIIDAQKTHADMHLDSAGLVTSLFRIHDIYSVDYDEPFCASAAIMDAEEGKRHHETKVTYDRSALRATYLERDVIKNSTMHSGSVEIPSCAHEVIGALLKLRGMNVPPGQAAMIPMSDGQRTATVKIEAQEREEIKTLTGTYQAIRYEANMLNGVVYTRKGRAFIWLSDDEKRLPVQIRLRMPFPIGTVTLSLSKEEHP
jgi:Protein of unknown function (DUF3108)